MRRRSLENLRVVLVGTQFGGNVGSACRAMANCGIGELRLAAPSPDLTWEFAQRMAVHATGILERRKVYPDLASAVADCAAVVGTSRRGGLYRKRSEEPRVAVPGLLDLAEKAPVALVFGREDSGLNNEEIALCTHLIHIPSSPDYPSFNLAQAVVLLCHEFFCGAIGPQKSHEQETETLASHSMRARMLDKWRALLLRTGFMDEAKADHMMEGIGRIFARGALTEADVRILMGVARQSEWALDRADAEKEGKENRK